MSLQEKINYLTSECYEACKKNVLIPLTIIGSGITKLFFFLNATFLLLWITKAVDKGYIADKEAASALYADIMIYIVIVALFVLPIFGLIGDKYSPFSLLVFSFGGRIASIALFAPFEDPTNWLT